MLPPSSPNTVETAESQLLCVEIDLASAERFDQCVSAVAMLDKRREYSFTMAWENGETADGSFRTGARCEASFVCPPAPAGDGECAGAEGEHANFINTVMVRQAEAAYDEYGLLTALTDVGAPSPLELGPDVLISQSGYFSFGDKDFSFFRSASREDHNRLDRNIVYTPSSHANGDWQRSPWRAKPCARPANVCSPLPRLGALLALPALVPRRRRA